jgi:hypothetical protein
MVDAERTGRPQVFSKRLQVMGPIAGRSTCMRRVVLATPDFDNQCVTRRGTAHHLPERQLGFSNWSRLLAKNPEMDAT